MASYHNTPFTKLCLGMTRNDVKNWILVNYPATSLYNVIANEDKTSKTNLGRAEWISLINGVKLQDNCNKEGFNIRCSYPRRKLRIGIFGNNQKNCNECNTGIGFGIIIDEQKLSSGNIHSSARKKTFGYIFVR